MAEEKKDESKKPKKKSKKDKKKKGETLKELKIAYRSLEDPKKFRKKILLPLIMLGVLVFLMPFVCVYQLQVFYPAPRQTDQRD